MEKNKIWIALTVILLIVIAILGYNLRNQSIAYSITKENDYNKAFYEVVEYVQNVKTYLAKTMISKSAEHGAEMLTHVWRESNLAQSYLGMLPIESQELENTEKFLNQVSEYSYSLATKCINNEDITDEELDNLEELYKYCKNLQETLTQLANDMGSGNISWKELTKDANVAFAQQVDNLSSASFSNLDENFGEYEGLIYDGAYSEHIESAEKKGLVGEEITEEQAKDIAKKFASEENIEEITSNGLVENGNIVVYEFAIKIKDGDSNNPMNIAISKKGGHVVLMNYNREVVEEKISVDDAEKKVRSKRLLDLSEQKRINFYARYIGTEQEVLFEKATRGKAMHGFTANYIRVELPAKLANEEYDNQILRVRLGEFNRDKSALQVELL